MEQHQDEQVREPDIHLWQNLNPVVTEVLTQLTWGGPQVVYNGGSALARVRVRVRYYDAERRRPGLPDEVAALVSAIDMDATVVTLVNLSVTHTRALVVQAGAFAEHDIASVRHTTTTTDWAGRDTEYLHHEPVLATEDTVVDGPWLDVTVPPGCETTLRLVLRPRVRRPSVRTPWLEI